MLAGLTAIAVVAPLVLAVLGEDDVLTRNLLAALVPALCVLGAGYAAARAGLLAAAALCAGWLVAVVAVARDPLLQRDDWRGATAALGPPNRPGGRRDARVGARSGAALPAGAPAADRARRPSGRGDRSRRDRHPRAGPATGAAAARHAPTARARVRPGRGSGGRGRTRPPARACRGEELTRPPLPRGPARRPATRRARSARARWEHGRGCRPTARHARLRPASSHYVGLRHDD